MPLQNALPYDVFPGQPWSAVAPQQALELITIYNLDEKDALVTDPGPDLMWATVGTRTAQSGGGIVKFAQALPSSLAFQKFEGANSRVYNTFDAVVTKVQPNPFSLNFTIPMVWDSIGNGWKLMSTGKDGELIEFLGINNLGGHYVVAGRAQRCQVLASLFYSGMYCTNSGLNLIAPTALTYPQPNNPNGIALFTDGTGAEGTAGARHYANPTQANSGRFANLFTGYGPFLQTYGTSLVQMTLTPHAVLPNVTAGARVTDTFGGTAMRDQFWRMMVQTLTLQTSSVQSTGVAGATTNPYADAVARGMTEDNFIGSAFGPRRFWILPQLDNHPYLLQNPGKGMWFNVSAGKDPMTGQPRPTWAKLAANTTEWVPMFRFYGPGDPRAMNERLMRFEGDLDGNAAAGTPTEIQGFFET